MPISSITSIKNNEKVTVNSIHCIEVNWKKDSVDQIEYWSEPLLHPFDNIAESPLESKNFNHLDQNCKKNSIYFEDDFDNIWCAAKRGDVARVKYFLDRGQPLDMIDETDINEDDATWLGKLFLYASRSTSGYSPLDWACLMNQVETVKFLLEKGARNFHFKSTDLCRIHPEIIMLLRETKILARKEDLKMKDSLCSVYQEQRKKKKTD